MLLFSNEIADELNEFSRGKNENLTVDDDACDSAVAGQKSIGQSQRRTDQPLTVIQAMGHYPRVP